MRDQEKPPRDDAGRMPRPTRMTSPTEDEALRDEAWIWMACEGLEISETQLVETEGEVGLELVAPCPGRIKRSRKGRDWEPKACGTRDRGGVVRRTEAGRRGGASRRRCRRGLDSTSCPYIQVLGGGRGK